MDRHHRRIATFGTALAALALLGGCSTTRGVPDLEGEPMTDGLSPVGIDVRPEGSGEHRREPDIEAAVQSIPELPMQAPVPRAGSAGNPPIMTLSELRSGFHLSADTGWLVLPVPRIHDDIEPTYPDHIADPGSGVRLFLPVPGDVPVTPTVSRAPPVPDVSEAENGRDVPTLPAVVPAPPRSPSVLSAGVASGGVQTAVLGVAGEPRDAADPGASTPQPATISVTVPSTVWTQRRATVDDRSDITVVLPGDGWIYVGSEYGDGEARFVRKETDGPDDAFVFSLSGPGDYGLWFQREDRTAGTVSNERLQIRTEQGAPARIAVGGLPEVAPTAVADTGSLADREVRPTADASAEPVAAAGTETAITDSGVTSATDGGIAAGAQDWLLEARTAAEAGDVPAAVEYFRQAIAAGGVDADRARDELFRLAEVSGDVSALGAAEEALRAAGEFGPDYLRRAAAITESAGQFARTAAYYEELIGSASRDSGLDSIYFRLATILAQPGPSRDLPRALSLYQTIVDVYPLSAHWEESAAEIAYLKRHFFDIR